MALLTVVSYLFASQGMHRVGAVQVLRLLPGAVAGALLAYTVAFATLRFVAIVVLLV